MKLRNLFEEINLEDEFKRYADYIRKRCQPFLQESNYALMRGQTTLLRHDERFYGKSFPINRRPTDMPKVLHNAFVDIMKKLDIKARRDNSIFTTKSHSLARNYGPSVRLIFPEGDFHYAYAPRIHDLYQAFARRRHELLRVLTPEARYKYETFYSHPLHRLVKEEDIDFARLYEIIDANYIVDTDLDLAPLKTEIAITGKIYYSIEISDLKQKFVSDWLQTLGLEIYY